MAVNLQAPVSLLPVKGVRLGTVNAGIRYKNRDDMLLIELAEGAQVAAVFTKNAFCAAPVTVSRAHLAQHQIRYLVTNAGNANAGTGEQGLKVAEQTCALVAAQFGGEAVQVLPFSTGVIGQQLPVEKIAQALPALKAALLEDNWMVASKAIMTTDTIAKGISLQVELDGKLITLTGIAKGAGMIHPNMATMLSYVATDAACDVALLQGVLNRVVDKSFNSITIDGDTSTNDSLVLMASGQSGATVTSTNLAVFEQAVLDVCMHLAQAIVRDGEGATKFITIQVEEALDTADARAIGNTVALSPLVKTAMFASDPNWGRILAAVGRAPVANLDVSKITIWLGDTLLVQNGEPASTYTEALGQKEMKQAEIRVRILLGRGKVTAQTWTCDFSFDYVKINAEYRS